MARQELGPRVQLTDKNFVRIAEFEKDILVVCRRCRKCAHIKHQSVLRVPAANNLACIGSPHVRTASRPGPLSAIGTGVLTYLYGSRPDAAATNLWALNAQHLAWLEEYVAAGLREKRWTGFRWGIRDGDYPLHMQLPKWLTSKKNRQAVPRGISPP